MANKFATVIQSDSRTEVVGVMSRERKKAKKFARKHRIGLYTTNLNGVIQAKPSIVYVATPVNTHFEILSELLIEGINVLCEKPIVTELGQFRLLQETAAKTGAILIEAMWMHWLPTFKYLDDILANHNFGSLKYIDIQFHKNEYENGQCKIGLMNDYGIYGIAVASRYLENLAFQKITYSNYNSKNLQLSVVLIDDKDVLCHCSMSKIQNSTNNCNFFFEKGHVLIKGPFNRSNTLEIFDYNSTSSRHQVFRYKHEGFEFQNNAIIRILSGAKSELNWINAMSDRTLATLDNMAPDVFGEFK